MKKLILTTLICMMIPVLAQAQTVIPVDDDFIQPGETVTMTSDNIYLLTEFVFVEDGSELIIEPGTVIKAEPGTGSEASALIIARGGKINANGTPDNPIIFTSEADDLNFNLPLDANGLWGGVIILGKAELNSEPGETAIEGIPTDEPRGIYGCGIEFTCDNEDNSGTFRYVQIRYGGSEIGAGNEINGLTMGGVGSGTTIEYVEVFNNFDDGFEWFGGTVNTKYLVSSFPGDDAFDYDEGFRGKGQFWFTIMRDGNRAGEHDGGTDPETATPFATPTIYNVTYIGNGADEAGDNDAFVFRDNAGGFYYNSIFTDFSGKGITIEDLESGEDSRSRLENGDLDLANNIWWDFNVGNNPEDVIQQGFVRDALLADGKFNEIVNPQLGGISRTNDGELNPVPSPSGAAYENVRTVPDDGFFTQTDYRGAFGANNWAIGWTAISQLGILDNTATSVENIDQPVSVKLNQNYPNPFNPTTNISFELDFAQYVTLEVYDVTGRKVRTLVNGVQSAGVNTVSFDASGFASGVYMYRLTAGNITETKAMMLVK